MLLQHSRGINLELQWSLLNVTLELCRASDLLRLGRIFEIFERFSVLRRTQLMGKLGKGNSNCVLSA
ncbi:hypothetical protein VNO80_21866 [Phaseolus coccineus]|uniref:Uncharacterized protein n=1 Tax=Phaseolus coccineus TaxID=3886 RepID=A0AAN9M4M6_PHACN